MDAATAEKMLEGVFEENGVLIDDKSGLLRDYILNSFVYIGILIGIEEAFDIEFPDEMLLIDHLGTFENMLTNVLQLVAQREASNGESHSSADSYSQNGKE